MTNTDFLNNKRTLIFFCVVILFNLSANFAHPVTPALIVERNLDSSMFGVALASMMSVNFLTTPMWGKLCNYVPTKRVILICSIGYSIGQLFFAFANSEVMVIFARMFAGIFCGGVFAGMSNYVINTAHDSNARDRNLITLATVQNVASACGYFVGGMLGVISIMISLIAQVVCLALAGILFFLICLDDTAYKHVPEKPLTLHECNPFLAFKTAKAFITPSLALIFLLIAVASIGQNSYEQCFNYFIKDQFNMSSAYNGTFKALIAFMTLLLNSTVCVALQKKTDINCTFLYILFACTALISLILIFTNRILFIAVYIIYSSVNVIRLPLLQSMIASQSDPKGRNNLMGFYQSMGSLGGIFGALFAGLIYKRGVMLPFILAFIAYGVASLIGVVYVRQYKNSKKS